jgi:hypothetical protein
MESAVYGPGVESTPGAPITKEGACLSWSLRAKMKDKAIIGEQRRKDSVATSVTN